MHTFLRLKDWLSGIQSELDASWAVLGEIYGSNQRLAKLGLILRRVRSNLDDQAAFARNVDYIPERIELAVARPNLLKLLIAPLYGNVPSIGVRELMQNAIDAVREREALQDKYEELRDVPLLKQENDVEIWIDDPDEQGNSWLTISDRGAGMTVDIIRNYFLTAGASFRNSEAWQREFETDEAPKSRVLRSGRFGVGMLAGFMLGSRMEVATRHIRSEEGIRFTTEMGLNAIELKRDHTLPVGTTVRIHIPPAVRAVLLDGKHRVVAPSRFDWFVYDHPTISRSVGQERQVLRKKFSISLPNRLKDGSVRQIRGEYGYKAYWTFADAPVLSVNGISITTSLQNKGVLSRRIGSGWRERDIYVSYSPINEISLAVKHPNLLIEDPDGVFPLNLQRNGLSEPEYPFYRQLVVDIIDDYLAFLIVNCPENKNEWLSLKYYPIAFYGKILLASSEIEVSPIVETIEGITIFSAEVQKQIEKDSAYIVFSADRNVSSRALANVDGKVVYVNQVDSTDQYGRIKLEVDGLNRSIDRLKRLWNSDNTKYRAALELTALANQVNKLPIIWSGRRFVGARLLVPKTVANKIHTPALWLRSSDNSGDNKTVSDYVNYLTSDLEIDDFTSSHSFVATKNCPKSGLCNPDFADIQNDFCLVELCLDDNPDPVGSDKHFSQLLTERWQQIIRHPVIPYEPQARRQLLSHAYESLSPFIAVHEAIKAKKEAPDASLKTSVD